MTEQVGTQFFSGDKGERFVLQVLVLTQRLSSSIEEPVCLLAAQCLPCFA